MAPSTVALVARRDFEHHGQIYVAGELFYASHLEAVVLLTAGRAKFAREIHGTPPPAVDLPAQVAVADAPEPPADAADAPKPKRKYTRRNLTADDGETPKPKRKYTRRDLTPED